MEKQKDAAQFLTEMKTLLELSGENVFKVRAYDKAIGVVADSSDFEKRLKARTLMELPGIGKGISELLYEWARTGGSKERDELLAKLPQGLIELTRIPGLGPKKARQVIDELGVHSTGELEYAIRENRLLHLKGFGEKAQTKILEGIEFLKSNQGQILLSEALQLALKVETALKEEIKKKKISADVFRSGPLRRSFEVLSALDFIVRAPGLMEKARRDLTEILQKKARATLASFNATMAINIEIFSAENFGYHWFKSTGSDRHVEIVSKKLKTKSFEREEDLYEAAHLPFLAADLRETGDECDPKIKLTELVTDQSVQGIFHNHSKYSDGRATLDEMVGRAVELGYKYIGISDHSQSAFYAQGLKVDDLKTQRKEIDVVRNKYPEIRVFWGVESDILQDGELDYDPKTLKAFDFVIASVHSRFQMKGPEMTERILKAIRNPYTRFLGHSTGRLLLGRKPYEMDMPRVIAEAKAHDVAIEINANPQRLDIDWRWGPELRKTGCLVSINPDAHDLEGLEDTKYGVTVARKALLPQKQIVNTRSVKDVAQWLARA